MANKWDKTELAYRFFSVNNDNTVTANDIAKAANWAKSTVITYIGKKWNDILIPLDDKYLYKVKFPCDMTWEAFKKLHSQKSKLSKSPTPQVYEYDVALSFAGEDRPYVKEVADTLKSYGIDVFYDKYEQHVLWGKNLYTHLDEVYRLKSEYCVIFLSEHYKEKLWTNHERESAQARAFEERREYILPVRLDDTEIPGIRTTVGYINSAKMEPTELANIIADKLGKNDDFKKLLETLEYETQGYEMTQSGSNLIFYCKEEDHKVELSISMLIEAMKSNQLDLFTRSSVFV